MEEKRTKNVIRNIIFGFLYKFVTMLFPFIIRTIIIKKLSSEYLGLSSLFCSIIQVLNLTELGFSSAIVYSMYKPIAEKDTKTICALMNLYKKIYRIIGIAIIVLGICLLPFLKYFIKGSYPSEINIYVLYLIYLAETGISYFLFAYKSSLIKAHQRNDIISNVHTIVELLQYVIQIVVLFTLKNYYIFVACQIVTKILTNISVNIITNKKYPNYICKGEIQENEKKEIKKRVIGLIIQKVCHTTRNSLDSIFISAFLGLNLVAIYSNYYSIMNSVIKVIEIITISLIASIGNSIATESIDKNYNDMNRINFIYMWIAGWCTICLGCLYQPFMEIWLGKEYMLSNGMVVLFCIYFYLLKMGDIRATYVSALGLWWENRYIAMTETIGNVVLNIVLVQFLGIYGIVLGTLITILVINFGFGSRIIFKQYFKDKKILNYFLNHCIYAIVTSSCSIVTFIICYMIKVKGIQGLILKGIVCLIVPNILFYLIYFKTKVFTSKLQLHGNGTKMDIRL